jgi:hypothetical protein
LPERAYLQQFRSLSSEEVQLGQVAPSTRSLPGLFRSEAKNRRRLGLESPRAAVPTVGSWKRSSPDWVRSREPLRG